MRKSISCAVLFILCFATTQTFAQAFEKKNILITLGIGMVDDIGGVPTGPHELGPLHHLVFSPPRPQFMIRTEFAVHKYWGVGFIASVDGRRNLNYTNYSGSYDLFNSQLGLLVNYHFYQLIADKLNRNPKLHADKIDIYTGFTMGATMSIMRAPGLLHTDFYPFMGLHLGMRYYVTPHLSVYGEFGIGQSYFNIGITYKFDGKKKAKPLRDF